MNTEDTQNQQPVTAENNTEKPTENLEISADIRMDLQTAGKWSQFLAILGFVMMGIMVFAGLMMSIVMSFIPNMTDDVFPFPTSLFGLIYIIMAGVYLFPVLYLFRFATGIKKALILNHQATLARAFTNLKSHYKSVGIIMIVFLCLYPIMMVAFVIMGVFSGMSGTGGFPV